MAPMKIHLAPTNEFQLFGGIEVQSWKGTTGTGAKVVALIAAIAGPADIVRAIPAPPPDHTWVDATSAAMSELWSIAGRLRPDEAHALVAIAKGWIRTRERKAR
jgi:hypothetical protein